MRTQCLLVGCALVVLVGCSKPVASAVRQDGVRRAGLWRQTIIRDGRATQFGSMRVCVDAITDAKMTLIGHAVGGSHCTSRAVKQANGSTTFHSICTFGRVGAIDSTGEVWSDFSSTYHLHANSVVRGSMYPPLNGSHATDINARYLGPCPSDMSPGEIIIGPGLKVNLNRLPIAGAAAAFG